MNKTRTALATSIMFAVIAFTAMLIAGVDGWPTPAWLEMLAAFTCPFAMLGSLAWLIRWDDLNKPATHAKPAPTPTRTTMRRPHTTVTWYEFHDNQ